MAGPAVADENTLAYVRTGGAQDALVIVFPEVPRSLSLALIEEGCMARSSRLLRVRKRRWTQTAGTDLSSIRRACRSGRVAPRGRLGASRTS